MIELNRTQIADLLGVTSRTVTAWQADADFPQPERRGRTNFYDGAAVVAWWRSREIGRLIEGEDGSMLDLNHERARLAKVQTQRQTLLLHRERGELVAVADVAEAVGAELANVRAHLLSLPAKCAPLVHAADTPQAIREILDDAVRDALAELSGADHETASAEG